jgi:hypothetical protein
MNRPLAVDGARSVKLALLTVGLVPRRLRRFLRSSSLRQDKACCCKLRSDGGKLSGDLLVCKLI